MKFLPAEFHQSSSIPQLFKLARENLLAMGSDAEHVVLSVGLALRDISVVHFHEEGEDYAEDVPEWVKSSPLLISEADSLIDIWGKQLPRDEPSDSSEDEDPNPKGKGKGKATGKCQKRKAKSPRRRKICILRRGALRKLYIKDSMVWLLILHYSDKGKRVKRGAAKPLDGGKSEGRKLRSSARK